MRNLFADEHPVVGDLHRLIESRDFPCVGAKSALANGQLKTIVARDIGSAWNDLAVHAALLHFTRDYAQNPKPFQSVAVIFERPLDLSEVEFEAAMWARLQSMSDKDAWLSQGHDPRVSSDPESPHFSLSFGGQGFFVVGLHPSASRKSRRFKAPVLIFNLHDQFERLRADGRYEKLRDAIVARDTDYSGSPNPMLARHGEASAARQFSGRVVEGNWRCPFRRAAHRIAPRSGVAFALGAGQTLTVIDPEGEQVADMLAFNASDVAEVISSGRTLDYASRIYLTTGDQLYSNRSNVMLEIASDDVGRHDFLLTPCSRDTFRIIYGDTDPHRGCFGNLATALAPHGVTPDMIPVAFNCFMNVTVDGESGELRVLPPLSRAGDQIVFRAVMDLVIGLTACSALQSNNGSFKPIEYEIG